MPDTKQAIEAIVGLGNPGDEYAHTRHNIGFMVVDRLARAWGVGLAPERRFKGIYGEGKFPDGGKLRLLKPTTFMNLSGQSVLSLVNWYKLSPQSVLAIYDDMDLPLGKIRLRMSGSAGGHNGMKSIISHLGTQEFPRLRIGIGRSLQQFAPAVVNHVLSSFSPEEMKLLPDLLKLTQDTVASINTAGIEKTMSVYNSRSISVGKV